MIEIETIVRRCLCSALRRPHEQADLLNMDDDLTYGYGLASLDRIVLMSAACLDAGVPLTDLDQDDIAGLRTPADIVHLLSAKAPT